MSTQYDDMLYIPHHVSPTKPQMSMADRAAQFSPFAALTGHDAAIKETARLTDRKTELTEDALNALNSKFQTLSQHIHDRSEVSITYFRPDERKAGGSYVTVCGVVRKIDSIHRVIQMMTGTIIPADDVSDIRFDII